MSGYLVDHESVRDFANGLRHGYDLRNRIAEKFNLYEHDAEYLVADFLRDQG